MTVHAPERQIEAARLCAHPAGCTRAPAALYVRYLTDAKYYAIPVERRPVDGVATTIVLVCEDHQPPAPCNHDAPPAETPPCSQCGAAGEQSCTAPDGSARAENHLARIYAQTPAEEPCRHAHAADCGGRGACTCHNEPVPVREAGVMPDPSSRQDVQREQDARATAERAYWADLLKRYNGDKDAAAAAAREEFAQYMATALAGAEHIQAPEGQA